jgi:hypothetical protein
VIKSRRIRWEGHIARMGERSSTYGVWRGNLRERERERDYLEDLGVDRKKHSNGSSTNRMGGSGVD